MRSMRFEGGDNYRINVNIFRQIWPYLVEFKNRVYLAIACLIAAKLASIGLPFALKHTVDQLNDINPEQALVAVPIALIIAYGGLRLLNVLLGEIRDTLFGRVTERAMRRLGLKVFQHLHRLDLNFHLSRQTGALSRDVERGTSGISFLMRFLVFNIGPTILEIVLVVGVLLFNYGWSFALVIVVAVVSYVSFSMRATDWRTRFVRQVNEADNSTNSRAIDSLLNYETVKYFGNEQFEATRYDIDLEQWEEARQKNRLSLFALNGGQAFIIAAAMTSMMLMAGFAVADGRMSIGDFVLINAFTMQIFMPLNFLGFVYREIRGALANIENLFGLLHTQPTIFDTDDAVPLSVTGASVRFDHVNFHYQPDRPIIQDLSVTIPAHHKVALVGESGSGKSTLTKLLFRFYDPQQGRILIDEQPIDKVTLDSLRSVIGIVPQDTVLFNDSIFENVRYGRPDASDEEVQHAIELAQLSAFIQRLPDGANTAVGERGLKLSGGEKQRVAIARTILKRPRILIFDEATSSLDSESEAAVMAAFYQVSQHCTSIIIAHRLSTVVDVDCILVLDDGKLVEQGTHQQLIAKQGRYAALWNAQQKSAGTSE